MLVISFKLLMFSVFFFFIKLEDTKKIIEKTTKKDMKTKGLNLLIFKAFASITEKKLYFFFYKNTNFFDNRHSCFL